MAEDSAADQDGSKKGTRVMRPKLRKALPTDRATVSKQLDILRAAAAASGPEKKAVSNEDVGKIVNLHFGTVSNCNPFFIESGLIIRQKLLNLPSDEVVAYAERYKWEADKAALKLGPLIKKTWFSTTLLPKLAFRALTLDEAVSFLAEEAGATPEYRDQLVMLIDYLKLSGIVAVDGNMISAVESKDGVPGNDQPPPPPPVTPLAGTPADEKPKNDKFDQVHPSIVGLLEELPAVGQSWSKDDMEGFMTAFEATLKFIYKVKATKTDQ